MKAILRFALFSILAGGTFLSQPAFADSHRVGVLNVGFSFSAQGSGQWNWGDSVLGETGSDALSVSMGGHLKYEVLATETNLVIGSLISSNGQSQTASGSCNWHNWSYNVPTDPEFQTYSSTYATDPNAKPKCEIAWDPLAGQFAGCLQDGGWIENVTGDYQSSSGEDYFFQAPTPIFTHDGEDCADEAWEKLRRFNFTIPNPDTNWSQTLSTNATPSYTHSGYYLNSDCPDDESGSATASVSVTLEYISDRASVQYTASPNTGTVPLTIHFATPSTDSTGTAIRSWNWSFGDGATNTDSSAQEIDHTYTNAGTFTVTLACTNTSGKAVVASGPSTIQVQSPTVAFTADRTNGTARLSVNFSCGDRDSGGGLITQWAWNFGDGSASSEQSPTHVYTKSGHYTVVLTAVNRDGYSITGQGPATITAEAPTVQFKAAPALGIAPLSVIFECPTYDSGGNLLEAWGWNFGDKKKDKIQNPQHLYKKAGLYLPTLAATNFDGDVVMGSGPTIEVASYSGLVLNGNFETGDYLGWTNSNIYSAVGRNAANTGNYGALLGMAMDYNSDSTLSQTLLTQPGTTYLLSFWVNNPPLNHFAVCWSSNTVWEATNALLAGWTNIQLLVTANSTNTLLQFRYQSPASFYLDDVDVESEYIFFTANPADGTAPLTVQFTAPSVDNNGKAIQASSYQWDFGDDTTGTGQNPSHTYLASGKFTVQLVATNSAGMSVAGIGPSVTVALPTAEFTASPLSGTAPLAVQFSGPTCDSKGSNIVSWAWDFGDGATSSEKDPSHTYTNTGNFAPALLVSDSCGVLLSATGPSVCVLETSGLVVNGGFESGRFDGWTESGNFTYCMVAYSDYVHSGGCGAQMGPGGSLGYLSQNLPTQFWKQYLLSFWLRCDGKTPNEFSVWWGGTNLFDQKNLPDLGWTNMQFIVEANDTNTTLKFGFMDNATYLGLDDVSVIYPEADFTESPTNGHTPLTVQFTCPSVDTAGSAITQWLWHFGDGTTSTVQNPLHTYTEGGVYSPWLFVTNAAGMGVIGYGPTISIDIPPVVSFSADSTVGEAPLPVHFNCPAIDSNGNSLTGWRWDFGDGATSTAQNPSHTFLTPGRFAVSLVATNSNHETVTGSGPLIAVASRSGLVLNGDFETGDYFGWSKNGTMNYCTVSDSSQYVHSNSFAAALMGSVGFDGNSISQVLNTTPGANYQLSFWVNVANAYSPVGLTVSWDGKTIYDQSFGTLDWTNVQLNVAATGATTVLQFGYTGWTIMGLDDVIVKPSANAGPRLALGGSGAGLKLCAANAKSGAAYWVLMSTNLGRPLSQWTPISTNYVDSTGNLIIDLGNAAGSVTSQKFFILQEH